MRSEIIRRGGRVVHGFEGFEGFSLGQAVPSLPPGSTTPPAAFTELTQGVPAAANAFQGVQNQLLSENPANATNGILHQAQSNFASTYSQLAQNQIVSSVGDLSTISNAAAGLIMNSSTILGAVQNVEGLIQGAKTGNAAEIVQSFTGVLVSGIGLEIAAGAISFGVGAAIVAGIELASQAFAALFQQ